MLKNIDNKFEESRRSTLSMSNVPKTLIDKIHKLLELSNISKNNSESEAYAALLKAQELMAKYHLELSDVYNSKTEDIIKISCEHNYDYKFRYALAGIIAKNFRVKAYVSGKQCMFYEYKSDAYAAKQAFEFAYRLIVRNGERLRNQAYSNGLPTKYVFNSYAVGFLEGMEKAFDAQCETLQIITPIEISNNFETLSTEWSTQQGAISYSAEHSEAYNSGMQDAQTTFGKKSLQ